MATIKKNAQFAPATINMPATNGKPMSRANSKAASSSAPAGTSSGMKVTRGLVGPLKTGAGKRGM